MSEVDSTVAPEPEVASSTEQHSEDLVMLDAHDTEFRTENNRLQMKRDGEWQDVTLARLFPLSEQENWISVVDKEDKEIGVFRTLHGMPHAWLACIRAELHRRYLVPEVTRITACRNRYDFVEWSIETDRGPMVILTQNPHEQIKPSLLPKIMLTDVEGNRYDIPDIRALDVQSRAFIEQRM